MNNQTPRTKGTVLVTGATSGIGLATASSLRESGWTVLVHGRTKEKTLQAIRRIHSDPDVQPIFRDLGSAVEVDAIAEQIGDSPLDAIIHNACPTNFEGRKDDSGVELTFAVGHLAAWRLTALLLPKLASSKTGRVVFVGSQSHKEARGGPTQVVPSVERGVNQAYAYTKLANLTMCLELARRWKDGRLQAFAFDPGPTETPMMQKLRDNQTGIKSFLMTSVLPWFSRMPEDVGRAMAWALDASQARSLNGKYIHANRREIAPARRARDPARAAELWQTSKRLTGLDIVTSTGSRA